jgi:hypothetical protein
MALDEKYRGEGDVNYDAIMGYFDRSTDKPAAAADIMGIPPRRMGGIELRAQVSDYVLDLSYEETKELEDALGIDPHAEDDSLFEGLDALVEQVLLEDRTEALKQKFVETKKVSEREFEKIMEADPTNAKKYVQWMLNKFVKDIKGPNDRAAYKLFFEDLYKITDGLELFDRIKKKFSKQDINQYGLKEFADESFEIKQKLGAEELEKGKAKTEKYSELKIGTVAGFTVYKLPQGREDLKPVACDLGSGTNWCTAHNQSNYYNTYNRKDPLFVFIKGDEKYQYHIQSNQFMDKQDRSMQQGELRDTFEDFIEKVEGRPNKKTDLGAYQVGQFEANGEDYPVYKLGNKHYTEINNAKIFYDPDTKLLKDANGNNLKPISISMKHPYIDFMRYIFTRLSQEEKDSFNIYSRIVLGLEPETIKEVPEMTSLNLTNADIDQLPNGLKIKGDLTLTGSKVTQLPKDIEVGGRIIDHTGKQIN